MEHGMKSFVGLSIDVTAVLRPGVYILRDGSKVVWVGAAKSPAARIHAHLAQGRGAKVRAGLPKHPVTFDSIELRPCLVDDLSRNLTAVAVELRWCPQ